MTRVYSNKLLTKKQVSEILQVSTRTIDRMIEDDRFPRGIKIGSGRSAGVRWPESVPYDWIAQRVAQKVSR